MAGTMILLRSKLAAAFLQEFIQADFFEGLGDDIEKLDMESGKTISEETKAVAALYREVENFRDELLDRRRKLTELFKVESGEDEDDTAP